MVRVETFHQLGSAKVAMSPSHPCKNAFLSLAELATHLLTQYSVRTISRTGRLDGGFRIACSLTRFTAAANGAARDSMIQPCFRILLTKSVRLDTP